MSYRYRYLGLSDGRRLEALRHVQALLSLFGRKEIIRAVTRLVREVRWPKPTTGQSDEKQARRRRAIWAIRKMRRAGFTVTEIATVSGVDHAAISRLMGPDAPASVSQATSDALVDSVRRVASVRVRELLADVPIEVIDTCCDKGATVNTEVRDAIANTARALVRNALLLEANPVPAARHIEAFVARVGHEACGVYVVCAPYDPQAFETIEAKIRHLEKLEHELEHLLKRKRAERIRLQGRRPGDGCTSGRIA